MNNQYQDILTNYVWKTYKKNPEKTIAYDSPLPIEMWMHLFTFLDPTELISLFFANIIFKYNLFSEDEEIQPYKYTNISSCVINFIQDYIKDLTFKCLPFELFVDGKILPNIVTNPRIQFLSQLKTPNVRKNREVDNINLLSLFCKKLTILRLPQGQWQGITYLNHTVVRRFLVNNPNLCIVDVSGYNINSDLLLEIFKAEPICGKKLEYLKFNGEQSNTITNSVGGYLSNTGVDFIDIDNLYVPETEEHNFSYRIANTLLRKKPIEQIRTIPETPNRVYCTNNNSHSYCKRCFRSSLETTVHRKTTYSRKICPCMLRRLLEMYKRYGEDYTQYCECTLTYIRYSICLLYTSPSPRD